MVTIDASITSKGRGSEVMRLTDGLCRRDGSDGQHVAAKGDPGMNPRTLDVTSYRTYVQASEARKCHEAPGHAHLHTLMLSIDTSFTPMPGSAVSISRVMHDLEEDDSQ